MQKLTVKSFSCITEAELDFQRLTVLIGPQASGKSVLCKLAYFFIDALFYQIESINRGAPIGDYINALHDRFCDWFPVKAWGGGKFELSFLAGSFGIAVSRKIYRKQLKDDFSLKLNEATREAYEKNLRWAEATKKKAKSEEDLTMSFNWRVYETIGKSVQALMGADAVSTQTFIPAGRSFFTSVGKALAAFEQGRMLDPLTIRFGRTYTAYKERQLKYLHRDERKSIDRLSSAFAQILGGKLTIDGDREYVVTPDGREMPLFALSSGQQELLPLVTILPMMSLNSGSNGGRLIYIEEMEAHLFPAAQSKMVELLASMHSIRSHRLQTVLTTHSPYVLSKINNLLYAGRLGSRASASKRAAVEKIVPRESWLSVSNVAAYAIKNGVLHSIKDSDGFINGDYLDDVSGDIGREFASLQEVEYGEV